MLKIFVFIDTWFVKQDIQKWLKIKICRFLWRIWKWKQKRTKNFTFLSRDLNRRFSVNFPPMIWILMWSEEPEIKSKQASKRDRTLQIATIIKWPPIYEVRPLCLFTRIYHEEFHALSWLYSTSTLLPKTFFLKSLLTQSILNRFFDSCYLNLNFVFLLEYCPRNFTRLLDTWGEGPLPHTPFFGHNKSYLFFLN